MKRTIITCLAALAVLGFTILYGAPKPQPVPAPALMAAPAPVPEHPDIRAACRALENAKGHLETAAHDFGGHRVKALEHTNHAIEECHEALKFKE